MNTQTILISGVVVIFTILVLVIVLRKKEKFSGSNVASAVLTTDNSGNISVANSLALNTLDVDNGLTLNQSAGTQGYVMTSMGSGSNPVWQPGFMRFVGVFPTVISTSGAIAPGQTIISANLTNLTPGKTLLVKADMGVYGDSGSVGAVKATLTGGDTSDTFYVKLNSGGFTSINFRSTIKNANAGTTTVLSLNNVSANSSSTQNTIYLYPGTTANITVYEIQ
jgi:hypothetical protein